MPVLAYLAIALIGLIPVNRDFVEAGDGVEIFVYSGEFHSDLILPIDNEAINWRNRFSNSDFGSTPNWATHFSFGWGDRNFYLNTPNWSDLKLLTAGNALILPSETVMHVSHEVRPTEDFSIRSVKISTAQYKRLVDFILNSFSTADGKFEPIRDARYHKYDAFYKANGSYHCFKTCNCWVGQALKTAGVKTGWFTPFPKTPFLYFPK